MNDQTIYVAGYPKSGTTYLTRLLGDVLNSPTGGCVPSEDKNEVATEGLSRPGSYVVRKGHFVLIDDKGDGPVVPHPHRLAWQQLTNERIIFLVRDPRDICVSGAYHWNCSVGEFLERMIVGSVARCGRWDKYCNDWLKPDGGDFSKPLESPEGYITAVIKYEDLITETRYTISTLGQHIYGIRDTFELGTIDGIIERQSFANRKAQIGDNEQDLKRNNMRKGVVGDWRNHFNIHMDARICIQFGWMMERLGYDIL